MILYRKLQLDVQMVVLLFFAVPTKFCKWYSYFIPLWHWNDTKHSITACSFAWPFAYTQCARFGIGQYGRVKGHIGCVACISRCLHRNIVSCHCIAWSVRTILVCCLPEFSDPVLANWPAIQPVWISQWQLTDPVLYPLFSQLSLS